MKQPWHGLSRCFFPVMAGLNMVLLGVPEVMAQPSPSPRALSTDRPDKTESPFTVDRGYIQIEADLFSFTTDSAIEDNRRTRIKTSGVASFNLKYGVGLNSDFQFMFEPYVRQAVIDQSTGARAVAEGIGDTTIRLKHNLFGNDVGNESLALMPFITVPTGSGGIGSRFFQGGLIVPLAIKLRKGVELGLMSEIDLLADAGGRYLPGFVNSATLGFDLTDALGLYTEVYTEQRLERGSSLIVTLDAGITYALSPNTQMDIGANLGATRAADDLSFFVGLSRRF